MKKKVMIFFTCRTVVCTTNEETNIRYGQKSQKQHHHLISTVYSND